MFKKIFCIKTYSVQNESEEVVSIDAFSIPALIARLAYLGIGVAVGAKTQILATNKYLGFKDTRLIAN